MIKEYRIKRGYTQEKLAELIGISTRQLQRLEETGSDSKMSTLRKIIDILDISDEDLIKYIKRK